MGSKKMRLKRFLFLLIFLLLYSYNAKSNPIIVFYLNELLVDSTNWKLELHFKHGLLPLDGCYLTSAKDTAYFKNGIYIDNRYLIITKDSLQNPFHINPNGDEITLYSVDDNFLDRILFGDITTSFISVPKPGQSICLQEYHDLFQRYYYYLDNSPTLGSVNDSSEAMGFIEGIVTDSLGKPIEKVEISYMDIESMDSTKSVLTDSSGYFIFQDMAKIEYLKIHKDGYIKKFVSIQIWPDSMVTTNIELKKIISSVHDNFPNLIKEFELFQNYPNPFNSETTFSYRLPVDNLVDISVFDVTGKLQQILFSGFKHAGFHKIKWNATTLPSGLYFFQIRTSNIVKNKKCLIVK